MSKNRRGGLGRGIGALIPTSPEETGGSPTDIFFGGRSSVGLRARPARPASEGPGDGAEVTPAGSSAGDEPPADGRDIALADPLEPASKGTDDADQASSSAEPRPEFDEPPSGTATPAPAEDDSSSPAVQSASTNDYDDAATNDHDDAATHDHGGDADRLAGPLPTQAPSSTEDVEDLAPVPGARLRFLPVAAIRANARQPRTAFDEDALNELAYSIQEFGVLQPVVVRPDEDGFELVMGERRLRAAVMAGLESIPAVIRDTDDDAMLRDALLENIHRAQLNPLEEAAAYQQLLQEFGVTHDQLATRLGRSRSQVSNTIRLLNLPVPVQRRVAAGVLSAGHARALLALENADAQDDVAGRIVAEGLSVRATEELVSLAATGHAGPSTRRRPARRFVAPAAADLAERLSDTFDTRVRVDIGRRKGRITVEFASIDDLERIVALMAPDVASDRPVGSASGDEAARGPEAEAGSSAASIEAGWRDGSAALSDSPLPSDGDGDATAAVRLAAVPPWEPADTSVR
ncbi:MAG: ParB/RepB/Spo0J family partition protein [bacterium]